MSSPEVSAPRALLVDDHELVRLSTRVALEHAGVDVVGEAGTIAEAVDAAALTRPDIVLLDVRLPDGSGVDACPRIRAVSPKSRILFLSAYQDEAAMFATAFAVADGYILKDIGIQDLVQAIGLTVRGLSVVTPKARRPMVARLLSAAESDHAAHKLSQQERRTLAFVAQGKTNKEIAAAMGLSPTTVKNYLSRIFQKMGVTRRAEAVASRSPLRYQPPGSEPKE
ncbi:MAG TPA: response regulator transcription factor [Burkholderiales bacterium]|nr:response regulator transcription factor [Burkholderiales bacterium]